MLIWKRKISPARCLMCDISVMRVGGYIMSPWPFCSSSDVDIARNFKKVTITIICWVMTDIKISHVKHWAWLMEHPGPVLSGQIINQFHLNFSGTSIYECSNSHIICKDCFWKIRIKKCPTCNIVFSGKKRGLGRDSPKVTTKLLQFLLKSFFTR